MSAAWRRLAEVRPIDSFAEPSETTCQRGHQPISVRGEIAYSVPTALSTRFGHCPHLHSFVAACIRRHQRGIPIAQRRPSTCGSVVSTMVRCGLSRSALAVLR
jgi:hypothetical protein